MIPPPSFRLISTVYAPHLRVTGPVYASDTFAFPLKRAEKVEGWIIFSPEEAGDGTQSRIAIRHLDMGWPLGPEEWKAVVGGGGVVSSVRLAGSGTVMAAEVIEAKKLGQLVDVAVVLRCAGGRALAFASEAWEVFMTEAPEVVSLWTGRGRVREVVKPGGPAS